MNLSQHFTLEEATKSQTALRLHIDNTPDEATIERMKIVARGILEPIRAHYKFPFSPTSFYRCTDLNRAIGSKDTSQHVKGEAVDLELAGVSNYDLACWIRDNLKFDQLILESYTLGVPSSGWVHCSLVEGDNRNQVLTISGGQTQTGLIQ